MTQIFLSKSDVTQFTDDDIIHNIVICLNYKQLT